MTTQHGMVSPGGVGAAAPAMAKAPARTQLLQRDEEKWASVLQEV